MIKTNMYKERVIRLKIYVKIIKFKKHTKKMIDIISKTINLKNKNNM